MEWKDKPYQYGVSQGILYPTNGAGIPWNGLTKVEDKKLNLNVTSIYDDGIKYDIISDRVESGVKIDCYSYPSALDGLTGYDMDPFGILYDEQELGFFSFAYRVETDIGYKRMVYFNVMASPSDISNQTMESTVTPVTYSFEGECVPVRVRDRRTARIELDSRHVSRDLMDAFEHALTTKTIEDVVNAMSQSKREDDLIAKLRS